MNKKAGNILLPAFPFESRSERISCSLLRGASINQGRCLARISNLPVEPEEFLR
jgi:hypothetical protein